MKEENKKTESPELVKPPEPINVKIARDRIRAALKSIDECHDDAAGILLNEAATWLGYRDDQSRNNSVRLHGVEKALKRIGWFVRRKKN